MMLFSLFLACGDKCPEGYEVNDEEKACYPIGEDSDTDTTTTDTADTDTDDTTDTMTIPEKKSVIHLQICKI